VIQRYSYICILFVIVLFQFVKKTKSWYNQLQQSIRDEKYLIGRQLHNLDLRARAPQQVQ